MRVQEYNFVSIQAPTHHLTDDRAGCSTPTWGFGTVCAPTEQPGTARDSPSKGDLRPSDLCKQERKDLVRIATRIDARIAHLGIELAALHF